MITIMRSMITIMRSMKTIEAVVSLRKFRGLSSSVGDRVGL